MLILASILLFLASIVISTWLDLKRCLNGFTLPKESHGSSITITSLIGLS